MLSERVSLKFSKVSKKINKMEEATKSKTSLEIEINSLLSRITAEDEENLYLLNDLFKAAAKEEGLKVTLAVVGGILKKPLPRRDIDVLAVFENSDKFPRKNTFDNSLDYSIEDFKLLRGVVDRIEKSSSGFSVSKVLPPAMDEEFGYKSILKHDGSIQLTRGIGTPIEIIRLDVRGIENFKHVSTRPFVILSK